MSIPSQSDPVRERLLAAYQQALGHELPNRLVAIQGMVRLLQTEEGERVSSEGRQFLEVLAHAARRAHELVRGLAEVGRVVTAASGAEAISVAEVAREAGTATKQLYPAVVIEYHFSDPSPRLAVGRAALYQVFFQLLQNAALSGSGDRPLQIEVCGDERAGQVEFWVKDNGRGFSEAEKPRLFEAFAPSDMSGAGTGLGLFLVSQVVSAWGGTLSAESTPGQGATFRVRV